MTIRIVHINTISDGPWGGLRVYKDHYSARHDDYFWNIRPMSHSSKAIEHIISKAFKQWDSWTSVHVFTCRWFCAGTNDFIAFSSIVSLPGDITVWNLGTVHIISWQETIIVCTTYFTGWQKITIIQNIKKKTHHRTDFETDLFLGLTISMGSFSYK